MPGSGKINCIQLPRRLSPDMQQPIGGRLKILCYADEPICAQRILARVTRDFQNPAVESGQACHRLLLGAEAESLSPEVAQ